MGKKYVVFGMGGVGASVAERLARAGRDVTGIARGAHLEAMREGGLAVQRLYADDLNVKVSVVSAEDYSDVPDVVFLCTKAYSLDACLPFLERVCDAHTLVVPLLNVYGTGEVVDARLRQTMGDRAPLTVNGCIYVSAELGGPGKLVEHSAICRIVMGTPEGGEQPQVVREASQEILVEGLDVLCSENVRRDTLKKFLYVSCMGAVAVIYGCPAGSVQVPGEERDAFVSAQNEVIDIAHGMGIEFDEDVVAANLRILDSLNPAATTSMQRDLESGNPSEFDGLICEVVRLGERYGVATPTYDRAREAGRAKYGV